MKFFLPFFPAHRRFRTTLLDLHTTGVLQVFRRPSLLRVWVPLRENFDRREDSVG
jgi:hypothetical protein